MARSGHRLYRHLRCLHRRLRRRIDERRGGGDSIYDAKSRSRTRFSQSPAANASHVPSAHTTHRRKCKMRVRRTPGARSLSPPLWEVGEAANGRSDGFPGRRRAQTYTRTGTAADRGAGVERVGRLARFIFIFFFCRHRHPPTSIRAPAVIVIIITVRAARHSIISMASDETRHSR